MFLINRYVLTLSIVYVMRIIFHSQNMKVTHGNNVQAVAYS
jgi:hypothetical protein